MHEKFKCWGRNKFDSWDGFEQTLLVTINCKILHLIIHCKVNPYDFFEAL